MKLPNCEKAIVEDRKLLDYLLSEAHPIGRAKARFFKKAGFSRKNSEDLKRILLEIANHSPVEEQFDTPYGKKYLVKGDLPIPSGRKSTLVTIWVIEDNDPSPRFVTAYPFTNDH